MSLLVIAHTRATALRLHYALPAANARQEYNNSNPINPTSSSVVASIGLAIASPRAELGVFNVAMKREFRIRSGTIYKTHTEY